MCSVYVHNITPYDTHCVQFIIILTGVCAYIQSMHVNPASVNLSFSSARTININNIKIKYDHPRCRLRQESHLSKKLPAAARLH